MQINVPLLLARLSLGGVAALLSALFGTWDLLLSALVGMMVADYCTGVIAAALQGRLCSRVGMAGAAKKVLMFALVLVAALADTVCAMQGHPLRSATCLFYIGNEGISIIENLGEAGVPLPHFLTTLFARLREGNRNPPDDGDDT